MAFDSVLEKLRYICDIRVMGHYTRAYPLFSRIRGFYSRIFQDMLFSLSRFSGSDVAQQRMKIINFCEEYREKATTEAFGADRKVISRWRKRLRENGGSLAALIPHSTRPHRVRHSDVPEEIIDFIKGMREVSALRQGEDKTHFG